MVHHIDAWGSVDQHKLQKLVQNAPVRATASKKPFNVADPQAPPSSCSDPKVSGVMAQVHNRSNSSHGSTESMHRPRSYSIEGTSSTDSIHAPKSRSKRLQDASARLSNKSDTRSWNSAALERHRSKMKEKNESKSRVHATDDQLHSQKNNPEPKTLVNDDYDNSAMDIDDDYPPPRPKGTLDSIHATSSYY
jgi:hypothetical protein